MSSVSERRTNNFFHVLCSISGHHQCLGPRPEGRLINAEQQLTELTTQRRRSRFVSDDGIRSISIDQSLRQEADLCALT